MQAHLNMLETTMDNRKILSANLVRLMNGNPNCNTQLKLAQRAGLGKGTIGRILHEEVSVTGDTLSALAQALGVEAYELLIDHSKPQTAAPVTADDTFDAIVAIMQNWEDEDFEAFQGMIRAYKKMR
jgi:transcriptional regulator with XRE-family HTH domain